MLKEDLHVHTTFSFDADAKMEDLVVEAIEKNISVLCFTDHLEVGEPLNTYPTFDFNGRIAEFVRLKAIYGAKIKLLLGLEYGEPNLSPNEYAKILSAYDYDMIIGSVHTPSERYFYDKVGSLAECARQHYQHTLDMVKNGGFEVLGHMDYPKGFIDGFPIDEEASKKIMLECVKHNVVPEINTSDLSEGKEQSPSMKWIEYYRDNGGKYVTIGSDTHDTGTLALHYDKICKALPKGLQIVYFEKRKLFELTK